MTNQCAPSGGRQSQMPSRQTRPSQVCPAATFPKPVLFCFQRCFILCLCPFLLLLRIFKKKKRRKEQIEIDFNFVYYKWKCLKNRKTYATTIWWLIKPPPPATAKHGLINKKVKVCCLFKKQKCFVAKNKNVNSLSIVEKQRSISVAPWFCRNFISIFACIAFVIVP